LKLSTLAALTLLTSLAGLLVGICGSGPSEAGAKSISYKLPNETATFKPGPDLEIVQNNCTACHSVDYVQTQPRGPKFKEDFWRAEVTKMIKVYGSPIDEAGVSTIVDYLARTY
jgi:sulfite dehydrogenase (cytochrome) subunit B